MPIYTYICKTCGEKFDLLVGIGSGSEEPKCKKCKSKEIEKQFASFAVGVSSGERPCPPGPACPTGDCSSCFQENRLRR